MKKAIALIIIFFIFVGSVGAFETNNIGMLQCLIQCGLCAIIAWGIFHKQTGGKADE
jgi:hypothetical protein